MEKELLDDIYLLLQSVRKADREKAHGESGIEWAYMPRLPVKKVDTYTVR